MMVRFTTPSHVLGEWNATKVVIEGEHGSFCLKPRHIDWVGVLDVGISEIVLAADGDSPSTEVFVAHDSGILVKKADDVFVSVRRGLVSDDLDELRETVEQVFQHVDSQEKRARAAAGKLEVGFVRRFLELQESLGG